MLLDTSAWIELFNGTLLGEKIKKILLSSEACYTSIITFSEVANWAQKEEKDTQVLISKINEASKTLYLDESIAILAGKINFERKKKNKKWGIADSLILATSLFYNLKIVTKDRDFEDLPNVEILFMQ